MSDRWDTRAKHWCPVCGQRVKRTDSYSQKAPTFQVAHFTCVYPPASERAVDAPNPEPPD